MHGEVFEDEAAELGCRKARETLRVDPEHSTLGLICLELQGRTVCPLVMEGGT